MILSATAAVAMLWLSVASAQQSQKKAAPAAKKTAAPAAKKSTPPKKGAISANVRRPTTSAKKAPTKRPPATTWRNRQLAPSADRYREIQTALAARGFLHGEDATGVWNQTSADALKKFQSEQNLESSGKINSLSLIALGLGPKRDPSPVVPPKPQLDQGPQR
jgi:hypothetical protein